MLVAWLASPPLAESRYRPVPGAGTTSGALTSLSRPVFVPIFLAGVIATAAVLGEPGSARVGVPSMVVSLVASSCKSVAALAPELLL
jgi:hypothetical protein